jgi:hypothetical protein
VTRVAVVAGDVSVVVDSLDEVVVERGVVVVEAC